MPLTFLGQIALSVSEADRAALFYGETLGLPLLYRYGDLVFFDLSGVRLMFTIKEDEVELSDYQDFANAHR